MPPDIYEIRWKVKDTALSWVTITRPASVNTIYANLQNGREYTVQIRALSTKANTRSAWVETNITTSVSIAATDPVTDLVTASGSSTEWTGNHLEVTWTFVVGDISNGGVDPNKYFDHFKVDIKDGDSPYTTLRTYENVRSPSVRYTESQHYQDTSGALKSNLRVDVYAVDIYGTESTVTTITVGHVTDCAVSNLQALALEDGVQFTWDANVENDFSYYEYRTKIGGAPDGAWSDPFTGTAVNYFLTFAEQAAQGAGQSTVYIEVRAVDRFGSQSSAESANEDCNNLKTDYKVGTNSALCHFDDIQDALDGLVSGSVITVKKATYSPSATIDLPTAKTVTIRGENQINTIINMPSSEPLFEITAIPAGDKITFDNFSIVSANTGSLSTDYDKAIYLHGLTGSHILGDVQVGRVNFDLATPYSSYIGDIGVYAVYFDGHLIVEKCFMYGGAEGVYPEFFDGKLDVRHNTFQRQSYAAVYLYDDGSSGPLSVSIDNNLIQEFFRSGIECGNGVVNDNRLYSGVTYLPTGHGINLGSGYASAQRNKMYIISSLTAVVHFAGIGANFFGRTPETNPTTPAVGEVATGNTIEINAEYSTGVSAMDIEDIYGGEYDSNIIAVTNTHRSGFAKGMYFYNAWYTKAVKNTIRISGSGTTLGIEYEEHCGEDTNIYKYNTINSGLTAAIRDSGTSAGWGGAPA